jgi:hypothetical protein
MGISGINSYDPPNKSVSHRSEMLMELQIKPDCVKHVFPVVPMYSQDFCTKFYLKH